MAIRHHIEGQPSVDESSPVPVQVAPLAPDRAVEAGALLAASYANDPAFRHVFPNPEQRSRALRPYMSATALDLARHGHALAAYEDGSIVGVALWMPPDAAHRSIGRKLRMTPALLRVLMAAPRSFRAFAHVGSKLEQAQRDASWYLEALGLHPSAQHSGIGSRLLTPVLAMADAAGLPCQLHTSDPADVAYFRGFGFEVHEPVKVFLDGPAYTGMVRAPRQPE